MKIAYSSRVIITQYNSDKISSRGTYVYTYMITKEYCLDIVYKIFFSLSLSIVSKVNR